MDGKTTKTSRRGSLVQRRGNPCLCVFIHTYTRYLYARVCIYGLRPRKRASGIETNSNEYRLGESRNLVVSYTTVSRWEFRKTGAEGAVIDGIPPSFERVQLFIVDRYTVFRSCGPIRQVSPLLESWRDPQRGGRTLKRLGKNGVVVRGGGAGTAVFRGRNCRKFSMESNLTQSR